MTAIRGECCTPKRKSTVKPGGRSTKGAKIITHTSLSLRSRCLEEIAPLVALLCLPGETINPSFGAYVPSL